MRRSNSTKWIISLVLVALLIAVGVTVRLDNHTFTTQTAIGQSRGDFSQDFEYLERANRAFIEVVNRAKPAVVQITTTKLVSARPSQRPFDFFGDEDLFEYWFGPRDRRNRRDRRERNEPDEQREVPGGLGSGVIVSEDGYILTNNHVIEGAEDIKVILPSGREFDAEVIGRDAGAQGTDLAVLKIDGEDLPALTLGNSDDLQIGEWVIAVGSPFGLAQTVTRGMVSAKGRSVNDISIVSYADFIQTDAAINRGNSGGALINIRGELIGINTAIATGGGVSQGNVGVGFAIPINLAKHIMTELIDKGEVERGWLGIQFEPDLSYELAEKFGLDKPHGALVTAVIKNSPAEKGGLKRGDVIIEIDQIPIRDGLHLRNVIAGITVGKTVGVKVIRKKKEKSLEIKLGKRTAEVLAAVQDGSPPPFTPDEEEGAAFAGLRVRDLTDADAERYGHEDETGVIVVGVERRSAATKAGIKVGDLIQEIENEEITSLEEYRQRIKAVTNESKILLYVKHANGRPEYVTLANTGLDDK
ncbi:MAG: Do family serine endopeptidase [Candidatus Poribacteria bacterium]|nr:Do family serine endopeptidase [Candidatus Poribacteria bacterium]